MRTPIVVVLALLTTAPARAQFFANCADATIGGLERTLREHDTQTHLVYFKYSKNGFVVFTPDPAFQPAGSKEIYEFIENSKPRRVAVLFHAYDRGNLCTWAMLPRHGLVHAITRLCDSCSNSDTEAVLLSLQGRLHQSLHVSAIPTKPSTGKPRPVLLPDAPAVILGKIGDVLLPGPIADAFREHVIDTVVVIPTSVLGTIPFVALPLGGSGPPLIDSASVLIAPSISSFRLPPREWQGLPRKAIIVGDSSQSTSQAEVTDIERLLSSGSMLGPAASVEGVARTIRRESDAGLLYFATHGLSDPINPRDGSYLLLHDGPWYASQIDRLTLNAGPLVVMSACQTALGKSFDVGTVGLARSWQYAGASSVIMTLWSVEGAMQHILMSEFVKALRALPPDQALRRAMQRTRESWPEVRDWAGAAVFGLPTLPAK